MIAVVVLVQIGALAQAAPPSFPADRVLTHREQAAALLATGWDWIDGRQTKFYLIK